MQISSFVFFQQYNQSINNLINQSHELQIRLLNGGTKYSQLSQYGINVAQLLKNSYKMNVFQSYISANNVVSTNIETYNKSLDIIRDAITNAQKYISNHLPFSADPKNPHALKPDDIKKTINNFLKEIENALNQKASDGSYVFAGQHLKPCDLKPVKNLTELPLFTKNDINFHFSPTKNPDLPYITYHNPSKIPPETYATYSNYAPIEPFYPGAQDSLSWKDKSIIIGSDNTLQYGITSNDEAFQNTIDGLLALKSLANLVPDTKKMTKMAHRANTELSSALDQIQNLKGKIAKTSDQNTYAKSANSYALHNLTSEFQKIASDDPAHITVQLSQIKQSIQSLKDLTEKFYTQINNMWNTIEK